MCLWNEAARIHDSVRNGLLWFLPPGINWPSHWWLSIWSTTFEMLNVYIFILHFSQAMEVLHVSARPFHIWEFHHWCLNTKVWTFTENKCINTSVYIIKATSHMVLLQLRAFYPNKISLSYYKYHIALMSYSCLHITSVNQSINNTKHVDF